MPIISKDHWQPTCLRTPFHERLEALDEVNDWYRWKAYTTVNSVADIEQEYFAIRNSCSVFDLTPMSKYRVRGPEAFEYMDRLMTRNLSKLKTGRVGYSVWCNDQGRVIDDGTIFRLDETDYRICAAERNLDWFLLSAIGFDVDIVEETYDVAALSFQGPTTCAVLKVMGISGIETLKPFGMMTFPFQGGELMVSRTGFTGELGYELWTTPDLAIALWDALFEAGKDYNIRAIGAHALEMARIEAGFIQAGVDFMPALETIRTENTRSPLELGLDWLVDFNKTNFTGRNALLKEKQEGSRYRFAILDIEGNKPATDAFIYLGKGRKEVGHVTSAVWSPVCKANIALVSLDMPYGEPDDDLWAEIYYHREMKWHRLWARCTVRSAPHWNPPRRRATPPGNF